MGLHLRAATAGDREAINHSHLLAYTRLATQTATTGGNLEDALKMALVISA